MERPTVRSYSIRGSRITVAQRQAKTALQMVHGIEFKQEIIDLKAIFPRADKTIMEIGFGMGEATAIIAKNHPDNAYIAVDVHPPGIGKLLSRIDEDKLANVKVIEDDVHVVLEHMFADHCLDGIHLFFPDPWPKKKHHKRRIVNDGFLQLIHPKLKKDGFIHIATDWVPYATSIQEVFSNSDLFAGGVIPKPEWRPVTRFEDQGIDKDHAVNDMYYVAQ
ncbi:MAG: tRNA (guanosine(46)-N7)-methyltransferase TrmB [Actinobacteria bacterium]|uniref:tRNA (guanine(46)-N(7))-methyltransferase n=1 Tax=freshwater metagenome TaxID=449393 RepID=A0A6J6EBC6_9ZZZZ|nr:tRNA (guanosine(46)-N7)-methyltransferase TrmB [Actinomycetota bacterium]